MMRLYDLSSIPCCHCNRLTLKQNERNEKIDPILVQSVELSNELCNQAKSLLKIVKEDPDYIERELRAMRAVFNGKPMEKQKKTY